MPPQNTLPRRPPNCWSPSCSSAGPTRWPPGQITGTEAYAQRWRRLLAAPNAARLAQGQGGRCNCRPTTMIGALIHFITTASEGKFQPMPPNFGSDAGVATTHP